MFENQFQGSTVDSMAWFMKKKRIQKETRGHFFDLNIVKARSAKIISMAIMVIGGSSKLLDMEISWEKHNL